jgi:hypothetical protein
VGLIGAAIGGFSDVLPRIAGGEADISGAKLARMTTNEWRKTAHPGA